MSTETPRSIESTVSFHAHLYWTDDEARARAMQVRTWIAERFSVQLGRVHDQPVGPHTAAMYQVAFARELFAPFVQWLMLNRRDLSVLVHPNTGRARDDHLMHALWLGVPLALRGGVLSNDPGENAESPVVPNTTPQRIA